MNQAGDPCIPTAGEINTRTLQAVVPPDRHRVAFHQLQEPLQHRFFHGVARSIAIGTAHRDPGVSVLGTDDTVTPPDHHQQLCGQEAAALSTDRPDRCPIDLLVMIQRHWHAIESAALGIPLITLSELQFAVAHDVIRSEHGIAITLLHLPQTAPLTRNTRVIFSAEALQRFSQRTGPGLFQGSTFTRRATAEVAAKIVQALQHLRRVMAGHNHVRRLQGAWKRPQLRHDPTDGADQGAKPFQGLFGRDMAMATVMVKANLARLQHNRFAARLNRASTGWAMGVHHQGMPPTAVVDQIEGDNMICGLR